MPSQCEMRVLNADANGEPYDVACTSYSAGRTEDGVRCCRKCGEGMEREGFRVDWDVPS